MKRPASPRSRARTSGVARKRLAPAVAEGPAVEPAGDERADEALPPPLPSQ